VAKGRTIPYTAQGVVMLGKVQKSQRWGPRELSRDEDSWLRGPVTAQLGLGLDLSTKRTRKREFLDEMRRVVPWSRRIALIESHYLTGKTGRPPFPIATMLQIHFLQQWFGLSDPAMEEALYDVPLYRDFTALDGGTAQKAGRSAPEHILNANAVRH
jgi:hypothetical protein